MPSRQVAVAFGSNLGDRRQSIALAAAEVSRLVGNFRLSRLIETEPVGVGLENDPPYLNAVGVGTSEASVPDLLDALLAIESARGRTRPFPGAPRVIDLDLILAGDQIVHSRDIDVPHPRFRERRFVLEPLVEVAPEMRDPETGLTAAELLKRLSR
jgi:2-amino-4-hydroxy-6-hydroxymethyldihydropteridine diphosphokinase